MRLNTVNGGKGERVCLSVHNAEVSASIGIGQPCVYVMNGTNDGCDVVLPSTAAALNKNLAFFAGVATKTLAVGDVGESMIYGVFSNLILLRQTRTDSTGNWLTEAARSVGEYLSVDTVNNLFVTTASTVGQLSSSTATAATTPFLTINPRIALVQTLASYASSASQTSDTRTAITAAVKAFVRSM